MSGILPTPTVAAVGLVARVEDIVTQGFKRAGDVVLLLGDNSVRNTRSLGGSEYACRRLGRVVGEAPHIDLAAEAIQAGAMDFMRKPFTAETLRCAVQSALDRPVVSLSENTASAFTPFSSTE